MAVATVLLLTASCKWGHTKPGGQADSLSSDAAVQELTFIQVSYQDSVLLDSDGSVNQSIRSVWPNATCQSSVADSIRLWLADLVAHSAFPNWGEEDLLSPYEGNIADGQALVEHYGKLGMDRMMAEVRQALADSFLIPGMENGLEVQLLCQTDSFITLSTGYSVYTGGAHGGYFASGATFCKSDGHRLGWNIIDLSKKDQLIGLIQDGLKEYFEVKSDAELEEMLQLYDDPDTPEDEAATLPLPQMEPFFTEEGATFIYQQYEIAAYAAGLPSFTIPYEKLPLLK